MSKLTHYVFKSVWQIDARFGDVCTVLSDVMSYSAWWPEIRSVDDFGDGRYAMVARSTLPYELRFVSKDATTAADRQLGVIAASLSGDLEGWARFTVEEVGGGCRLTYDQEVDTNKALLNILAPVARPAFRANHGLMMKHGEQGLRTYMAGYSRAKG